MRARSGLSRRRRATRHHSFFFCFPFSIPFRDQSSLLVPSSPRVVVVMSTSSLPSSSGVASGGASRDSGSLLSSLTATHTRDSLGIGLARDSRDSRHPLGMMDSSVVGVRHGCGVSSSSENPLHILLIDNYDSYSYNLAQTLANANHATMPTVITNDAMTFDELDHFIKNNNVHAVVVSPGPGTPSNHKDVGVCRAIFERSSNLPLLGVCLGHQILGHVHGAAVAHTTPRDTPHHGRISRIKHDGTHDELFRGIGETDVVRYHSLCIHVNSQQAMDALVPTAWTEDGVIMAMRHRTRPHHGVQFHPESVLTTDGATMIRNFVDYVRGYWAHPNRATTTVRTNILTTFITAHTAMPMIRIHILAAERGGNFHPRMTATAQLYRITTVSEARREGEHQSQKRKNKERENHLNNSLTTNQFHKNNKKNHR